MERTFKKPLWQDAWRPVMLGLALIQGTLLLNVERDRINEARTVKERLTALQEARSGSASYNPMLDPKVGHVLPRLALSDLAGKRYVIPSPVVGKQCLIIFAGKCAPCVAGVLQTWQQAADPRRYLCVVSQSNVEEIKQFQRIFKLRVPFLLEGTATASVRRYNAVWRPRAYLLDEKAHLLYIQPRWESSKTALTNVSRLATAADAPGQAQLASH